ncbi:MAG TPA: DUF1573 domain-containing protein [Verrucomicrobiae bacterium]|jgi:hypothetical protein|nr:DUF1573 domain-containing protein [Verrucomicrobiae bacterium]
MKAALSVALGLGIGALCFADTVKAQDGYRNGTPIIQFETNFCDLGKLAVPGTVSGAFKFKNTGTALLELAPPDTSCGCTVAKVTPDKLAPGKTGELTYTINLEHVMGQVQKQIMVHSNDPKTPEVDLTVQLDYTPLYELSPMVLRMALPADKDEAQASFTIVRNDGQPLGLKKLVASQKWLTAALDPSTTPKTNSALVNVTIRRPEHPPSKLIGNVQLWAGDEADRPVQTMFLSCDLQGELTATPSQIYWVIPDFGDSITNYPEPALTRTVELKSILDEPVKISSVQSSIKGLSAEITSSESGKLFTLILKFAELPHAFTSGDVTIDTSSALLPELKVPVTVSVAPK